ncbi:MAG: hypothetical protein ACLT1A_12820 [Dysosmobacter sp.]
MKKLLTLVLALAMTLSLAACGGGGEDTADEGSEGSTSGEPTKMTLILRGGAYGESLEASLAPFEAEHNVDIEVMLMSFGRPAHRHRPGCRQRSWHLRPVHGGRLLDGRVH